MQQRHLFMKNGWISIKTVSFVAFQTYCVPILHPHLHGSLKNQQPTHTVTSSCLSVTGRVRTESEFFQCFTLRNITILLTYLLLWKPSSQSLSVFNLTENSPSVTVSLWESSVKNSQWQLFNTTAAWGSNHWWGKQLTKKKIKKGKARGSPIHREL